MPTYRYRCSTCGDEHEVWQSFSEDPLTVHEGCGGELRKVLSPAGIVLKGSGFYKTDNRSNGGARTSEKSDTKESTDSKPSSDSKPDTTKTTTSTGGSSSGSGDSGSSSSGASSSGSDSNSKG